MSAPELELAAPVRPDLIRQLARFTVVGLSCTLIYSLLYLELRGLMAAQFANVLAALVAAVANTTLNRRITFGVKGGQDALRHQAQGLVIFAVGVSVTNFALCVFSWAVTQPSPLAELAVLTIGNLIATALRFLLLRHWVFGHLRLP
jgi:putative flippase GtrA